MPTPHRIVSLACSNTEIVCALGLADRLVAVDDHSDYPDEVVARLPRMGADLTPDMERVAAMQPDLVLATLTVPGHEKVVARLEAAGLPFMAPEPTCLDDVFRDIRDIAERLGVPERGRQLVAEMEAALAPATSPPPRRPSIAVQWWPKPVILPGRLSWVTDLIARAGGSSPLAEEEVKSRPVSDEELAELAPDAVVLSWCGIAPEKYRPEVVYENPAFADLPAVRNRRVVPIPEGHLGRPSPRLVEGYRALKELTSRLD